MCREPDNIPYTVYTSYQMLRTGILCTQINKYWEQNYHIPRMRILWGQNTENGKLVYTKKKNTVDKLPNTENEDLVWIKYWEQKYCIQIVTQKTWDCEDPETRMCKQKSNYILIPCTKVNNTSNPEKYIIII